jgi:hypothetical protein
MLFYLRANTTLRVQGISGPFLRTIGWLVNADNVNQAKAKFEEQVKKDFAHMHFSESHFEYVEVTGEIK